MENNCQKPCGGLQTLRQDFEIFRRSTGARLEEDKTRFAVIDTKLNWLIAILGAIGASVLGVLAKLAAGV